ncbi:ephrin type-B receptor 1-B isoform X2 [Nematostella vectensis]|uniref:ephrin type-B receptor 1-B isoform X2 n=1 Tax=Nematostella vectensis TaxID=45351 RepID=UPI002077677D|nr:ephrin type-B receptor 1-B isoform X2 [Nematostella vectensis]
MAGFWLTADLLSFLWIFLSVRVSQGERVTLLELPDKTRSAWKWDWSKFSNKDVWTAFTYPSGPLTEIQQIACDVNPSGPPNAWLRSDDMSVEHAQRLEVNVTFTARNCTAIGSPEHCHYNFDIYIMESQDKPEISPNPYLDSELFKRIGTLKPTVVKYDKNDPGDNRNSVSVVLANTTQYVYFALHYTGGCIGVKDFIVSYNQCPKMALSSSLVELPRTVSPAKGSQKVKGNCVAHSQPLTDESELYGYCQSNGEWSPAMYTSRHRCMCHAGYQDTVSACTACPRGTYKPSAGNATCVACPRNSAPEADRTSCRCTSGYFRAANEKITADCTAPPSAPQHLTTTYVNATEVTMSWYSPVSSGGRSDVSYLPKCNVCNNNGTICTRDCAPARIYIRDININVTMATIKFLSAYTYYRFKVLAVNGVSHEAEKDDIKPEFAELTVRTKDSIPGRPVITDLRRDHAQVFLSWKLLESNGVITHFEVIYYPVNEPSKKRTVNTTLTNITVEGLREGTEYIFEVRAGSRLGLGPPAVKKKILITKEELFTWEVIAGIAGAGGVLFIFMVIIIIICIHHKRRDRCKHLPESQHILELGQDMLPSNGQKMYIDPSNYGDPMEALMSIADEIDRDKIKLDRMIGGGEFAEVYEGRMKSESGLDKVAVKILKAGSSRKTRDDFLLEASVMGQFKHTNVIALKGVVTRSRPMMIVTEFMENGSLDHFLKSNDGRLTVFQLLGMARGVAAGMDYLSSINFIHRDLAARNILVSENMTTKVSDFGLSRELDDLSDNPDSEYQTQGGKIPVRWTAPEAIKYRKFSSASDVWSYGILLWEIMSFSERPYWGWDNFQVMERVEGGYRLPSPMNCPKIVHNLMLDCWHKDKCKRPKFVDIVQRIEDLIRSPEKLNDGFIHAYSFSKNDTPNFDEVVSIEEWLESINMGRYVNTFSNQGYMNLDQVRRLEEDDLSRLGIKLIGHRNKISKSIKAMNKHFEATAGDRNS